MLDISDSVKVALVIICLQASISNFSVTEKTVHFKPQRLNYTGKIIVWAVNKHKKCKIIAARHIVFTKWGVGRIARVLSGKLRDGVAFQK